MASIGINFNPQVLCWSCPFPIVFASSCSSPGYVAALSPKSISTPSIRTIPKPSVKLTLQSCLRVILRLFHPLTANINSASTPAWVPIVLLTTTMTRLLAAGLLFFALTSFPAGAAVRETNAERMAKGLPPLPPRWMPTRTQTARGAAPSPSPSSSKIVASCRVGDIPLCCNSAVPANDTTAAFLLDLGAATASSLDLGLVAITCSPLRSRGCSRQVVCCEHDNFDGVIATGCALQQG
ncbi:hypothetical protein B0H16DRAFT_1686469 [Mycena metata]|uniref:Hydrophobin n=1 Tax=Mycena metata TaxID=1033252 RepID=A0AAD7JMZ5_9AGAR|nr:hypothetical protein B0H16DRAFT_1686469 [Mycena metata]